MTNLTTELLNEIRDDIKTALTSKFLYGAVGEDPTAGSPTDTELGIEVFRTAVDSIDTSVSNKFTASLFVPTTAANGYTVSEVGWFLNAVTDVDTCDTISGWTDSTDMTITLNSSTFQEGTGAINLTKDGSTVTTASTTKDTASIDFTGLKLNSHFYFVDQTLIDLLETTDAITIRFGSDSSNYYQWTRDKADLNVGWYAFEGLNSANADSTTGTPVETAMDYFYVAIEVASSASTWADGDLIIDHIRALGGDIYFRTPPIPIPKTNTINLFLDTTLTITVSES